MIFFKSFFIFLIVTISSCDYLEKNSETAPRIDDQLVFVDEVPVLTKQKVKDISNTITGILGDLRKFCEGSPDLQKVKNFSYKLRSLKNYAKKSYDDNAYSWSNVKIKNGTKNISLGIYLLDINSILEDAYAMKYNTINNSINLKESCNHLKNNYRLSYAAHYNLPDNVKIEDAMAPLFKNINTSINCLCP